MAVGAGLCMCCASKLQCSSESQQWHCHDWRAGRQTVQPAMPQKAGSCSTWVLKALTEEHLCERNSTFWVGRHVKIAEPTRTLCYCCNHIEGTCSPTKHPGNVCPITQCSKSARALQCVGWTYFHLSTLALLFKGCWNGQGHAMCSLSRRPLSFHPGMTSSQLHARPATPHAQKQIPRIITFSGSWQCKGLRLRPMSWYVRMTGLFPLGVPRMVT